MGVSLLEINECDSSPCWEDQVCEDLVDSYQCRCRPGEFEEENGGFCQRKYFIQFQCSYTI